eukprot:1142481-Rhodomonas_salina.1
MGTPALTTELALIPAILFSPVNMLGLLSCSTPHSRVMRSSHLESVVLARNPRENGAETTICSTADVQLLSHELHRHPGSKSA